jgi:ribosomal protein S18 acetylase RimI-like enzyme
MKLIGYTLEDIYNHLDEIDSAFTPKLSSHINLKNYAEKIFDSAVIYGKRDNNKLVAMIAAYANNEEYCFITHVGVLPEFQGRGVAQELLTELINDLGNITFYLEVNKTNLPAIKLYQKNGFETVYIYDAYQKMKRAKNERL